MRSVAVVAALAACAAATRVSTEDLQNKLRLAPNSQARIKILDKDDDFVFDFLNPPGGSGETIGKGGHTVGASGANFPALIGTGMAMTVGFLGPCGFNTPHTHPRATEFNIIVAGSALRSGIIHENGGRFILNDVPLGSASIFQQGAIHFEQNLGCEPAVFVAGFNHEDPGVDQVANRFFEIDPTIVSASLGGLEVKTFNNIKVPANVALGQDECLHRCGIDRATFTWNGTAPYGLNDYKGNWNDWKDWSNDYKKGDPSWDSKKDPRCDPYWDPKSDPSWDPKKADPSWNPKKCDPYWDPKKDPRCDPGWDKKDPSWDSKWCDPSWKSDPSWDSKKDPRCDPYWDPKSDPSWDPKKADPSWTPWKCDPYWDPKSDPSWDPKKADPSWNPWKCDPYWDYKTDPRCDPSWYKKDYGWNSKWCDPSWDSKKAAASGPGGDPKTGAKSAGSVASNPNALLSESDVKTTDPSTIPFGENPLRTTVIALAAVSAALLLCLIAALIRIFTAPKRVVYDSLNVGARDGPRDGPRELLLGEKSYGRHSRSSSKVDSYDPPHDRE